MRLGLRLVASIYSVMEARGAYTPGAQEVYTITFETLDGF
jgi:hypothetical protein